MREVKVEKLRPGDLVTVIWADAWESKGELPIKPEDYDAIWVEFGVIYLYTQGRMKKHLVLAYSKAPGDIRDWNITAIPIDLVIKIYRLSPRHLQKVLPGILKKLQQAVKVAVPRRLNPAKYFGGCVKI